nr:DUF92 domain-containing protein [Ardenticatena sp.]
MLPLLWPDPLPVRLLAGACLATLIALAAWHRHALTLDGALAAIVLGTVVFALGGWGWAVLMVFFFISSAALSFWRQHKRPNVGRNIAKGARRDATQVFANGGWLLLWALANMRWSHPLWSMAAFGTLATAIADTWATEFGLLSPTPPRFILDGREVPPGTNGGITPLGLLASATAGLSLGFIAALLTLVGGWQVPFAPGWLTLLGGVVGSFGALLDSLLGATVQGLFFCPTCQEETEQHRHHCGTFTHHLRGWAWCNNDAVNALASLTGGLFAILITRPFF